METFFCDEDYQEYLHLMAEWFRRCGVSVWRYCLMPNHTHIIAVSEAEEGLRRSIGEVAVWQGKPKQQEVDSLL